MKIKTRAERLSLISKICECVGIFLLSFIIFRVVFLIFDPVFASGISMMPTVQDGTLFLHNYKIDEKELCVGDIVTFKVPEYGPTNLFKRVVALPGDTVQIINGYLYVNGELSPYNYEEIEKPGLFANTYTVPDNSFIGMGDNRNHSDDSRKFGAVPIDNIIYIINQNEQYDL